MRTALVGSMLALLVGGCGNELPTLVDGDLLPVDARTVEVRLPFVDFARDLQVVGGYGSPAELGTTLLAHAYEGTLEARTLIRFQAYPRAASVRDTTGTTRPDSSLTFVGGKVVAVFDTLSSVVNGPVTVTAGALQRPWHVSTASWRLAVDTVGDSRPWPEAGGGPVAELDRVVWDPAGADSVVLTVDSATVAAWADTTDASRGVRLSVETPGVKLEIRVARLHLLTRPSLNPDTIVELAVPAAETTFLYDPFPEPPADGIRIGGAPAWRTVFRMAIPVALVGPPELCAELGCPFVLTRENVSFAALLLTTRSSPPAFQPTDTVRLDLRPVTRPDRLPKSPMGSSLLGFFGEGIPPEAFGSSPGREVVLPITGYVADLLPGDSTTGPPVPETVALLSIFEPGSFEFASFAGPGDPAEPILRLIITVDDTVRLR